MTFVLALVFILGSRTSSAGVDLAEKKVLILHSFGYAQPAYEIIDASLKEAFIASGINFNNLYFEFMDLARKPDPDYRKRLIDLYRQKFEGQKIDLIVTLHTEALQFIVGEAKDLFPDVPVISILGPPAFEHSAPNRRVVILPFSTDSIATAKAIVALKPDIRKLVIVAGSSVLDKRFEARVKTELQTMPSRPEIESIDDLPLPEMLLRVANLPPGTALLYTTVYSDSTGKTYMPRDAARMVCTASNAPVFGLFETLLGNNGVVGGIVLDHRIEGQRAVRVALDALQEHLPAEPLTILPAPLTPMFDWQQLRRWGFEESALPAGSKVINKPASVWKQYNRVIVGTVIFILLESALIAFLFLARRRSKIAQQCLKKAEEKYRNIFNGAIEGIYESSHDGELITANTALARILGYDSPEELTSSVKNLGKEVWYNEHELEEYLQKLARENIVLKYECQFLRRDGTVVWVSLSTQRISNSDEQITGYSGFIEDITERILIESDARKLRDELAHITRVTALAELTVALAHEINQPLTAILSNAQAAQRFLSQEEPDLKEIAEILEDIFQDGSRAGEVIRKFRSLLKKEEVRYELLSLNHVIEEILSVIGNDMALMSVTVLKDLHPALSPIWGDRIQLQQVVLNLILNGIAAMRDTPSGRRKIIVRTTMPDERTAKALVRDCGMGIDEQQVDRLFHPFYTTKPEGLGIGLSISQTIVKAHGGTMEAFNNPEGGATFAFFLPAHQAIT